MANESHNDRLRRLGFPKTIVQEVAQAQLRDDLLSAASFHRPADDPPPIVSSTSVPHSMRAYNVTSVIARARLPIRKKKHRK